ncbi:hypothetical protein J2S62_001195 [Enteractinococcus fodinae]|uniref:Uncharacterized protein n=1 Tax=Enteractinococcus fodinae TaxID=684663 RepID=A0ABU2B2B9_9MICC|nr:hypothetical protein [Enteractinococcus fodinae]
MGILPLSVVQYTQSVALVLSLKPPLSKLGARYDEMMLLIAQEF